MTSMQTLPDEELYVTYDYARVCPDSPREQLKWELAEAVLNFYRAQERLRRAYVATEEAPDNHVPVRELADYLNDYPGIKWARFPSWGRRRAAAAGREQKR